MRARPMTMPSAIGTAPPESPVPAPRATNGLLALMTYPHRRLHLGGRLRQDDRLRHGAVAGEAVALVRPHLRRLRDDRIGADRALEFGDEAHRLSVSLQQRLADVPAGPAPRRHGEQRAAGVHEVLAQHVVRREPPLDRDELPARVALEGDEEEARVEAAIREKPVVERVAAPQDPLVFAGLARARIGRAMMWLPPAPASRSTGSCSERAPNGAPGALRRPTSRLLLARSRARPRRSMRIRMRRRHQVACRRSIQARPVAAPTHTLRRIAAASSDASRLSVPSLNPIRLRRCVSSRGPRQNPACVQRSVTRHARAGPGCGSRGRRPGVVGAACTQMSPSLRPGSRRSP